MYLPLERVVRHRPFYPRFTLAHVLVTQEDYNFHKSMPPSIAIGPSRTVRFRLSPSSTFSSNLLLKPPTRAHDPLWVPSKIARTS